MKLSSRTHLVAVGALAIVFGGATPVLAAVERESSASVPCVRSELAVPAWSRLTTLAAADPSGRFQVGTARDAEEQVHLLRWEDGVPTDLATRDLFTFWVADVNAGGEIVAADAAVEAGRTAGLRYRAGEFTELPGRAPYTSVLPSAINSAGQVAGRLDDPETGRSLPAVWSAANVLTVLELPADRNSVTVQDIDEDGTVLGSVWHDDGNTNISLRSAIVWYPDGTWRLLPSPLSDDQSRGVAISGRQVLGTAVGASSERLLLWNAATGDAAPVRGGVEGLPVGINARGSVTGYVGDSTVPVFLPAGTTEIRELPITDPVMGSGGPVGLTDSDIAYGNDDRGDGTNAVVRWDCGG